MNGPGNEMTTAFFLTDPDERWRLFTIVDDDWRFVAVACDLHVVAPPEWRGATWPPGNGDPGAVVR